MSPPPPAPSRGARVAASIDETHHRVDEREPGRARVERGARDRDDVGDVRRQLREHRRRAAERVDDRARRGARRVAARARTRRARASTFGHERLTSTATTRCATAFSGARGRCVVVDGATPDRRDDARAARFERGKVVVDPRVDARTGQPDRVDHPAARRLGDAQRRVARPREDRDRLRRDRAEAARVAERRDLGAVPERSRRGDDRIRQPQRPEVDGEVDRRAARSPCSSRRSHLEPQLAVGVVLLQRPHVGLALRPPRRCPAAAASAAATVVMQATPCDDRGPADVHAVGARARGPGACSPRDRPCPTR